MPHKILGVDLGAYSIKVVVATAGFRSTTISDYLEIPIPPGDGTPEERGLAALALALRQRGLEHELPYAAFPGDALSMRVLEFGFGAIKRTDLEKAVGAELEGLLPHDLDELVYDFEILPRAEALPAGAGDGQGAEPAFVAATRAGAGASSAGAGGGSAGGGSAGGATTSGGAGGDPASPVRAGMRVLCAATTRERVSRFLRAASASGLEPRAVLAAPTVYAHVVEKLGRASDPAWAQAPVLVIDLGHARTNLCVVTKGKAVFARSLSRGGRHVTQAIAKAWGLSFEDAERAKHADGFVASEAERAPSVQWQRISDVVRPELAPLVREVRQSLAACRAQTGMTPGRAVLAGGGGRLRGLASFLTEELGLPVGTIAADDAAAMVGTAAAARGLGGDLALVAHGVALEGVAGRPLFDLRKGELGYHADFSFLRAKAGFLAACTLAIIAFAALNAAASLYSSRREEGLLELRLEQTTTEMFGKPMALEEVRSLAAPHKEKSPLPRMSAFDQLIEISRRLPGRDQVKVDVEELEIKPQKVFLKVTADSLKSADEIEKRLREVDCFTDVQRGKVQAGAGDQRSFTLTITTKCMSDKGDKGSGNGAATTDKGEKAEKGGE